VSLPSPEELESLREERLSEARRGSSGRRREPRPSGNGQHPLDIEAILAWIDQLRSLLGDPAVDREPWRRDEFRL
jgi:hypothetical protein